VLMRAVIPILIIAIVAAVAAFTHFDPLRDKAAEYRQANEQILAELEHPAGVDVVSKEQSPRQKEGPLATLRGSDGWVLRVVCRRPEGMSGEEVVTFYQESAPEGWIVERKERPIIDILAGEERGMTRNLAYARDESVVAINLDNLMEGDSGTYE